LAAGIFTIFQSFWHWGMELNSRGRIITDSDIEYIRTLIERHKEKNRYDLSKILAEAWQWRQENLSSKL